MPTRANANDCLRIVECMPEHESGAADVVRAVHDEYGFTWEADGYHRDLYDIRRHYLSGGGMFWVLIDDGFDAQLRSPRRVVGCVGVSIHGTECELHRMYLLKEHRGRGHGRRLLETALQFARDRKLTRMIAWSDVKLTDAHRLYRGMGFVQDGERICDDPDDSREYGFWKSPI